VIEAERIGYREVARQTSFLDDDLKVVEPSPLAFSFSFEDAEGRHSYRCGDWETHATYLKWSQLYGARDAEDRLSTMYNETYARKGVVFAMGTVKARPRQWLLLGVIRLDQDAQVELPL
jgi:hypothetical protein